MKSLSRILVLSGVVALAVGTASCVPLVVGAVGGYMIADDGVRLQSPITKKPRAEEYHY